MGCDIHICSEVKTANGWQFVEKVDCDRDCELFGKISGIMNKGLPNNASEIVKRYIDNNDTYHSHSWLDSDEIDELELWDGERCAKVNQKSWITCFIEEMEALDFDDYRLVFAFDY